MLMRMRELRGDACGPFGARDEARRAAYAVFDELEQLFVRLVHLERNTERLRHVPRHVDEDLQPVAFQIAEVTGDRVAVRDRPELGDGLALQLAVGVAQRR